MKNNVLLSLFVLVVLACLVITGMESIHLVLKSMLYMAGMGVLLFIGLTYVINGFEEEEAA